MSRLRSVLGSERIERTDAGLALRFDWLDLDELLDQAARAADHTRLGHIVAARLSATMALDLVRGPLLPEHDAEWSHGPRALVERTVATLRMLAADAALASGDPLGASAAASAALDHDPYDEGALRTLMRAHVATGRPASALAAYASVRKRLAEDLGVSPTAETEALHEKVLLTPEPRSAGLPAHSSGAGDSADPLVQRARMELASTDFDGAWRDAEQAVRRGGGSGATELAGWVAYYRRDFASALRHAEAGAAVAREDERRASCLTLAGRVRHSQGELAVADAHLSEAARCTVAGVRGGAEVWLGALRNHQGRPAEALELLERGASDEAAMRHPFVLPHSLLGRVYALGQLGEAARAFDALADWEVTLDDLGPAGDRYRPALHNFWAWLLLSVGERAQAVEHSRAALVVGTGGDEPHNHSLLDLAAASLEAGDVDEASQLLERLVIPEHGDSTMAWHQFQRRDLLRAESALVRGQTRQALDLSQEVAADATRRGSIRSRWQADVVALRAAAGLGHPVDEVRLESALAGLDRIGGLEVWRATARLAAATGRSGLWHAAATRVEDLVQRCGPRARAVRAWASSELATLRG